jgi:3-oxoadipate enol-lactonase
MITVNGANFYYEQHGQGPVLVFVAGYTSDHTSGMGIMDALTQHFTVITFDSRGVGQTTENNPSKHFTAEQMADDTVALAKALGFDKAHYCGTSMGGTIVQSVAARHPGAVDKLIIAVSTAKWRQAMLRGLNHALKLRQADAEFDTVVDAFVPWVFGEKFLSNPKNIEGLKHLMIQDAHPQSVENQAKQAHALDVWDGRDGLKDIKAETLVLYGTEDVIVLKYEQDYLVEHIAHATLKSVPGGHAITVEYPKATAAAMLEFLL